MIFGPLFASLILYAAIANALSNQQIDGISWGVGAAIFCIVLTCCVMCCYKNEILEYLNPNRARRHKEICVSVPSMNAVNDESDENEPNIDPTIESTAQSEMQKMANLITEVLMF